MTKSQTFFSSSPMHAYAKYASMSTGSSNTFDASRTQLSNSSGSNTPTSSPGSNYITCRWEGCGSPIHVPDGSASIAESLEAHLSKHVKPGRFSKTQCKWKVKLSDLPHLTEAEYEALRERFGKDVAPCCEVSGGRLFPDQSRMPAISLTMHILDQDCAHWISEMEIS
jgi:hypothetical protein